MRHSKIYEADSQSPVQYMAELSEGLPRGVNSLNGAVVERQGVQERSPRNDDFDIIDRSGFLKPGHGTL